MRAYLLKKKGSKEPAVVVTQEQIILNALDNSRPGDLWEILITELNTNPQGPLFHPPPEAPDRPHPAKQKT